MPLSVRIVRQGQVMQACGDDEFFSTNVQLTKASVSAEIRLRGTSAAECLQLGQCDTLSLTLKPASADQPQRLVQLEGAVLASVELAYDQSAPACAVLRFVAESSDGLTDPLDAEDQI